MLNISSRRYVKAGCADDTNLATPSRTHFRSSPNDLVYSGKVFEPSAKTGSSIGFGSIQNVLVRAKHQSTQGFDSFSNQPRSAPLKRESDTTVSVTTDATSERDSCVAFEQNSKATIFQQLPYERKTAKAFGNFWHESLGSTSYIYSYGGENVAPAYLNVLNNSQSSLNTWNSEVDQETTAKKKTRRGGKKARERREKEKVRVESSSNSASDNEAKDSKQQVKYKTELCKNWIEKGKCSYSVRCKFAHGYHELVSSVKVEEKQKPYKQVLCENFHKDNYCSYGTRCVYIHDERKTGDFTSSFYGKSLLLLNDRTTSKDSRSGRLQVFKDLCTPFEMITPTSLYKMELLSTPKQSLSSFAPNEENLSCASDSTDTAESFIDVVSFELQPDA